MTNPNPGPAGSVTEARTVAPASSVTPATSTTGTAAAPSGGESNYVAASQTVPAPRTTLPDDHPQVLAASAAAPPRDAYRRSDPKDLSDFRERQRARRDKKPS